VAKKISLRRGKEYGTKELRNKKERHMGKCGFDTNRPRKCPTGFSNHSLHFFS
jgi:hypothetical protein